MIIQSSFSEKVATDVVGALFRMMESSDFTIVPVHEKSLGFQPRGLLSLDESHIIRLSVAETKKRGHFNMKQLILENQEVTLPRLDIKKRDILFLEEANSYSNMFLRNQFGTSEGTYYFGFYHKELHGWVIGAIFTLDGDVVPSYVICDMDVTDGFMSECFRIGSEHTCMLKVWGD